MRLRRRDREPAVVPTPQPSEHLDPSPADGAPGAGPGGAGPTSTDPVRSVGSEPVAPGGTSSGPNGESDDSTQVEAGLPVEARGSTERDGSGPVRPTEPGENTAPLTAGGDERATTSVEEDVPGEIETDPDSSSDIGPSSDEPEQPVSTDEPVQPTGSAVRARSGGASRDRQSRAPSIPEEADELLNGKRSPARALPRIIAIANQKGGVGKTTTTVNLGAALAEQDYRVLVVDLDPQGNATTGLGVEARNFEFSMYDVIMRDHPLEDTIEPTSVKNLFVAPATIDVAGIEIELVPAFSRELKL